MASCKTIGWAGAPKFHSKSMRSMVREHRWVKPSQWMPCFHQSLRWPMNKVWYDYQSEVLKLGSICSGSCLGCRCLPFATYLMMNDVPFMLTSSWKKILEIHDSIQAASCSKARFAVFCCRFHRDLFERPPTPMVQSKVLHWDSRFRTYWYTRIPQFLRHTCVSHYSCFKLKPH